MQELSLLSLKDLLNWYRESIKGNSKNVVAAKLFYYLSGLSGKRFNKNRVIPDDIKRKAFPEEKKEEGVPENIKIKIVDDIIGRRGNLAKAVKEENAKARPVRNWNTVTALLNSNHLVDFRSLDLKKYPLAELREIANIAKKTWLFKGSGLTGEQVKHLYNEGLRDFQGANLQDSILSGINLKNANLCCTDLENAFLQNADLRNANLQSSRLYNATLMFAQLQGAILQGADFEDALMEETNFSGTCCSNMPYNWVRCKRSTFHGTVTALLEQYLKETGSDVDNHAVVRFFKSLGHGSIRKFVPTLQQALEQVQDKDNFNAARLDGLLSSLPDNYKCGGKFKKMLNFAKAQHTPVVALEEQSINNNNSNLEMKR